jgi:hypothetical protein
VRSQSEYKISSNPKEGLGQRAQSSPDETDLYSEITVCMSQRPGSSRGFGFKVRGGDGHSPIIVDAITPGGAAYVCELSIGDEVLSMNGMTVAILSQDQIVKLMTEAVRTGQLRLRVRRYPRATRKKPKNTPSLRLTSAAKMVATEGGFYQILADIPKKPQNSSSTNQNRPQQSASPAGTLDSGHGSEQTLEYRDGSPSTRSPSNHSSPRHSPRRTVGSLPEEIDGARESNGARESIDENPWLNELGSFELAQNGGVKVKAPPQQKIYSTRGHQQDRNDFKHELSRTLTSYDLANALAIEEEENQRELSERIRKQELRQQDEFTNNQIRNSGKSNNQHWMVREAEVRRNQQYSVRK